MGYYMEQFDQDFRIPAPNKQQAYDLLKQWEQKEIAQHSELHIYPPLGKARTLEDALAELDWEAETDEDGSIAQLCFTGEKLHDEDTWLNVMAPAVEKGSKLMMRGEDGFHWCWYFDGESCVDYPGEILFPNMPED